MPDYVTIKIYAETRRLLRLIAAETGEQMVQVMQRLCEDEWSRLLVANERKETSDEGQRRTKDDHSAKHNQTD